METCYCGLIRAPEVEGHWICRECESGWHAERDELRRLLKEMLDTVVPHVRAGASHPLWSVVGEAQMALVDYVEED